MPPDVLRLRELSEKKHSGGYSTNSGMHVIGQLLVTIVEDMHVSRKTSGYWFRVVLRIMVKLLGMKWFKMLKLWTH
jgi:hypothetical protein